MKAVVTGGAGFIGSHLVEELITHNIETHVIDNMGSGNIEHVHPLAVVHIADICSEDAKQAIANIKPDIIFHLAAQADVSRSIQEPHYDAEVNIKGTIHILEACREAAVKKIIFSSTSGVYGDLQKSLLNEEDPAVPISYYGLSKLSAESYIRLYHRLFGLSYTVLRYGNVYGPRQTAKGEGGVVAVFLDKIKQGLPLRIHGDGKQTRDFIYVKDVVRANMCAMGSGDQETIQIGTAQPTSINDLVSLLSQIHESPIQSVHSEERKGDIKHSCLNHSKASRLLHWQPQVGIMQGLTETCKYAFGGVEQHEAERFGRGV